MNRPPTTYGLPKKREEVVEALNQAYANQNLEDQEYERRLHEATNAKSIEELRLVIFDFPIEIKNQIFPADNITPSPQTKTIFPPSTKSDSSLQIIMGSDNRVMPEFSNALPEISAIMSNQKVDFRLSKVPETPINIRIESILSSTHIDLRNENLDGKHINIRISGFMGEVKIMLPRGVRIERNVQMVAGELKIQDKQRSWINRLIGNQQKQEEIRLTVNITGNFWFGSIKLVY